LLGANRTPGIHAAMNQKYGILGRLFTLSLRLSRRFDAITGIAIVVEEPGKDEDSSVSR
jgi:hypothetical protein